MPRVLNNHMSDEELLRHVLDAYSDPENWKPVEKDVGGRYPMKLPSWGARDQGAYARQAVKIMHDRTAFDCPVCQKVSYGPYKIGPVAVAPACRNDDCASQWWNRDKRAVNLADVPERLRCILSACFV